MEEQGERTSGVSHSGTQAAMEEVRKYDNAKVRKIKTKGEKVDS